MYRFKKTESAFSLIEIMLAMVIVAALMIAMVPGITKRLLPKKREQQVFTFDENQAKSSTSHPSFCYRAYSNTSNSVSGGKNCSTHTFVVPENVYFVNITLVGGGGGGGSASTQLDPLNDSADVLDIIEIGNYWGSSEIRDNTTRFQLFIPDFTRIIKIKYMVAKGKDGGYASTSGTLKGGDGGDSSPMIYEHILPRKYMFGLTYKPPLNFQESVDTPAQMALEKESDGSIRLTTTNATDGKSLDTNGITYRIDGVTHAVTCKAGETTYNAGTAGFNKYCGIQDGHLFPSVPGGRGSSISTLAAGTYLNDILSGGKGGKTKAYLGAGSGGNGQNAYVIHTNYSDYSACGGLCPYTRGSTPKVTTLTYPGYGKGGGLLVGTDGVSCGTSGGGGGSGSFVRLLNVPVTPGEKLTVFVGGGGTGGISLTNDALSQGEDGVGGTSSAIARGSNGSELMYLVPGGDPGSGGSYISIFNSAPTDVFNDYLNKVGKPGRNYHILYAGNQAYLDNAKVDESLMTLENKPDGLSLSALNTLYPTNKMIHYKAFDNEPYKTFIRNFAQTDTDWDKKIGGFAINSNTDGKSKFVTGSYGTTYDGLYMRMLIDESTPAYIGGGGGFSPVDGRAVCPPFFMGNFDGRQDSSGTTTSQQHKNTFTIAGKTYKVTDYFNNCNTSTTNAQDGNYVLPDVLAGKYGSAGQGGPGGGFTDIMKHGAGGNGAPGYVIIDWTR